MNIIQIPTFTDNYVWIMHELNNDFAVVVDPGESKPIIDALNINNLQLSDILLSFSDGSSTTVTSNFSLDNLSAML